MNPGDLIHVHRTQPPRVGDIVVALQGNRTAAVGELIACDVDCVTVQATPTATWQARDAAILKVTRIDLP